MQQYPALNPQKGDLLAVALVILIAILTLFAYMPDHESASTVQIFQKGQIVRELSLSEDEVFTIVGLYSNEITIREGKAAITASDCPGEDCVHSGWISTSGRSIVCLPNHVEIRITGSSDVDFIVG